jgi:hypothetical protein
MPGVRAKTALPCFSALGSVGWSIAAAVVAIAMVLPGCYRKPEYTPPDVYPVSGKVVPAGRIPAHSLIKFVPPEGDLAAEGTIEEDGSFTLKTLFHEEWLPGAVAGPNQSVEIRVPLGAGPMGGQTIELKEKFTIEPKQNQFTVTLK